MTGWAIALSDVYTTEDLCPVLHLIKDKIYQVIRLNDDGHPIVVCEDGVERYISSSAQGRLISPLELLARQLNNDDLA